jgi:ABC-type phosphate transport system auxiliary subunit
MSGWSQEFEKDHLEKRKDPIEYESDQDSVVVNDISTRDLKKEKRRIEEELKTKRDSW